MVAALLTVILFTAEPFGPGDHTRTIQAGELERSYLVHIPEKYDPKKPAPIVLVLHGAGTNAQIMVPFCELNRKSDEAGFIAVYPNGTGTAQIFLTWNAGGLRGQMSEGKADDGTGFFFFPADEKDNNIRIFVIRSATEEVRRVS